MTDLKFLHRIKGEGVVSKRIVGPPPRTPSICWRLIAVSKIPLFLCSNFCSWQLIGRVKMDMKQMNQMPGHPDEASFGVLDVDPPLTWVARQSDNSVNLNNSFMFC